MVTLVEYRCFNDGEGYIANLGYFPSKTVAKQELSGLCPWDFNPMGGSGFYTEFYFKDITQLTLTAEQPELQQQLLYARKHAKEWEGSWHERAPLNWGTEK